MLNLFRTSVLVAIACLALFFFNNQESSSRQRRQVMKTLPRVCLTNGLYAFTFDEGPGVFVRQILDALKAVNTKATFHVSTELLKYADRVELLKEAFAAGHLIGLRYFTVSTLTFQFPT